MTVAILLAGGVGSRFGGPLPKQFQLLAKKAVALHSYTLLTTHPAITEVVVVVAPAHAALFTHPKTRIASPGKRRQDSLKNGLEIASKSESLVLIHDAARPLATAAMVDRAIAGAKECGACTVGMPLQFTVKEVDAQKRVVKTLDRSHIFEIQTPQVIRRDILEKGLQSGCEVTDDVSFAELLGFPVLVVEGGPFNIKITTPEDLLFAEVFLAI